MLLGVCLNSERTRVSVYDREIEKRQKNNKGRKKGGQKTECERKSHIYKER